MRKAAPEFREPPFWYPGIRTAGRRFCQNGGTCRKNSSGTHAFALTSSSNCYMIAITNGFWDPGPCCRDLLKKTVRRALPGRLGRS